MNSLTKKVINTLLEEQDEKLLQEVLNFYQYMKQKKNKSEVNDNEVQICNQYEEGKESEHFNSLIQELKLNNYII